MFPFSSFFFNATAPTEIYTLSLHDALPISHHSGIPYAHEDAFNRDLAIDIFKIYMGIYANKYRLQREPTFEDIARIHNGGPDGWQKDSTKPYWEKVKKYLD